MFVLFYVKFYLFILCDVNRYIYSIRCGVVQRLAGVNCATFQYVHVLIVNKHCQNLFRSVMQMLFLQYC